MKYENGSSQVEDDADYGDDHPHMKLSLYEVA